MDRRDGRGDALVEAVAVTAELCGTQLSAPAAKQLVRDLEQFPEPAVIEALAKCRKELKGRLTVAEIVSRIDDGRPGPDEAWGLLVWDESETAVLTPEMEQAQRAAWEPWKAGDKVGARYAFREAYTRLVTEARMRGESVEWRASLGWDALGRVGAIGEAVQRKRLSVEQANRYLPPGHQIADTPRATAIPADVQDVMAEVIAKRSLPLPPAPRRPGLSSAKRAEAVAELVSVREAMKPNFNEGRVNE